MKRITSIIIMLSLALLFSCGGDDSGDKTGVAKFGITGIALSVGNASTAEKVSRASLPVGAYVTWETWIENATWTLPYQGGSYTAWDIQTPAVSGDNVTQIVGFAKTCVIDDGTNYETGQTHIYNGYYYGTIDDKDYFFLTTKGTLHLPDGTIYESEYRQTIEITAEIKNYIETEVNGQCSDTFVDRLTLTLSFSVDPALFE